MMDTLNSEALQQYEEMLRSIDQAPNPAPTLELPKPMFMEEVERDESVSENVVVSRLNLTGIENEYMEAGGATPVVKEESKIVRNEGPITKSAKGHKRNEAMRLPLS